MSFNSLASLFSYSPGETSPTWDNNFYFGFTQQFHDQQLKNKIKQGFFSVPEGKIKDQQLKIKTIIQKQTQLLGKQLIIMNAWTYKTPLSQSQWISNILYHEYIILELLIDKTKIIYCSIEKNQVKIQIVYHKLFQKAVELGPKGLKQVQIVKRCQSDYWKPIKIRQMQLCVDYFDLIRFLYKSGENKKGYFIIFKNCQSFCNGVIQFLSKENQNTRKN